MRRLYKSLQEVITQNDIDKLEHKLKMFTKNIRRIKDGRDLYDAEWAFALIGDELERYLYHNVFGVLSDKGVISLDDDLGHAILSLLTANAFSPRAGTPAVFYLEQKYPNYMRVIAQAWKKHKKPPYNAGYYEELYALWQKDRDYHYQKMSRNIRITIKGIREALERYQKGIPEKAKVTFHKVAGIDVEYVTDETVNKHKHDQNVKTFLNKVSGAVTKIREYPKFTQSLKNLLIKYDPTDTFRTLAKGSLIGGYYSPDKDYVVIRTLGLTEQIVIHEIGHRYYYKFMPNEFREMWETRLESSEVELTEDLLKAIEDAFWKAFYNDGYNDDYLISLKNIDQDMLKYFESEYYRDVFKASEKIVNIPKDFPFPKEWHNEHPTSESKAQWAIDVYMKYLKEEKHVNMSIVSDYGNTHPREAYADAFSYFVLGGEWIGKIPEEMMSLFYHVSL